MYNFDSKNHIHLIDKKPAMGTSSVVGIISKPLTWWAAGKAVEIFGWKNPKKHSPEECTETAQNALETIKTLEVGEYVQLLKKAYYAHSEAKDIAAEGGTDLHSLLESYVMDCLENNDGIPLAHNPNEDKRISDFIDWSLENVEHFIASEVNTYSIKKWIGGIVDCVAKMKDGKTAIIDFKSSKEAYESQFVQVAGYDIQLREKGGYTPEGEKILKLIKADEYIIIPFGAKKFEPVYRYNTKQLRACFTSALRIYKLNNHI